MKMHIQSRGFNLTEGIREFTLRRLNYAVSFARGHIRRVTVHLSDINGPRGGNDKRCQLLVTMDKRPMIVIEDTENDLYAAIARATERAGRSIARHVGRKQLRRAGSVRLGAMVGSSLANLA